MKITKISPAVKTEGRYNVFVDDKYSFSLDELQLVDLGLKSGQEIDEVQLAEYKSESDFGKNYVRALDLISRRLRSEREIRDYAFRKQWSKENAERVVERLYKYGYLDDAKFARVFVSSRSGRGFSQRRMMAELAKKGIKKEVVDEVINSSKDFSETASLEKLIAKKRAHYNDDRKLVAYLARQGFRYDDIKAALE
ncbi:MAG: RecX family transcriptional regulator [Candidatus Nomurabacteria bacterium]|jgi:regulatory protein|nr:RecX family transcriptional regulator [Candidatus Nomurabacteria bacterium]